MRGIATGLKGLQRLHRNLGILNAIILVYSANVGLRKSCKSLKCTHGIIIPNLLGSLIRPLLYNKLPARPSPKKNKSWLDRCKGELK